MAATAFASQLADAAQRPDELDAILSRIPKEARELIAAEVIRKHVQDHELDNVVRRLETSDVHALGVAAMSLHFGKDFRGEFQALDQDDSGTISHAEFRRYLTAVLPTHHEEDTPQPTNRQLRYFALNSAIPFVVFGFLDNSIMIVGGDVVDDMIGSTMHLSTLACAAVANTFADVLGISVGNTVEQLTGRMGVPQPHLTSGQARLPHVRRIGLVSGSVGIFVGCILGMAPLLFIDQEKKALKDSFGRLDADGSGFLELREVVRALESVGLAAPEAVVVEFVRSMDLDHDGKISIEEFLKSYGKLREVLAAAGGSARRH